MGNHEISPSTRTLLNKLIDLKEEHCIGSKEAISLVRAEVYAETLSDRLKEELQLPKRPSPRLVLQLTERACEVLQAKITELALGNDTPSADITVVAPWDSDYRRCFDSIAPDIMVIIGDCHAILSDFFRKKNTQKFQGILDKIITAHLCDPKTALLVESSSGEREQLSVSRILDLLKEECESQGVSDDQELHDLTKQNSIQNFRWYKKAPLGDTSIAERFSIYDYRKLYERAKREATLNRLWTEREIAVAVVRYWGIDKNLTPQELLNNAWGHTSDHRDNVKHHVDSYERGWPLPEIFERYEKDLARLEYCCNALIKHQKWLLRFLSS